MAEPVIREIQIPENDSTILVYADGIAVISPTHSRIRTVWQEKTDAKRMHHVLQWSRGVTRERLEEIKNQFMPLRDTGRGD